MSLYDPFYDLLQCANFKYVYFFKVKNIIWSNGYKNKKFVCDRLNGCFSHI